MSSFEPLSKMLTLFSDALTPVITTQSLLLLTLPTWPRRSGEREVGSATGWQPIVLQMNGTSSRSTSLITMMPGVGVGSVDVVVISIVVVVVVVVVVGVVVLWVFLQAF